MAIEEKLRKVLESKIEEELVKGVEYAEKHLAEAKGHLSAHLNGIDATIGYGEEHAMEIAGASTAEFGVLYASERLNLVERKLGAAREQLNKGGGLREKIDSVESVSCGIIVGYLNHKENKAWAANVLKRGYEESRWKWIYNQSDVGSIRILRLSRIGEFVLTVAGNDLSVYNSEGRKLLCSHSMKGIESETPQKVLTAVEDYNLKLLDEMFRGTLPDYDYEWRREAKGKERQRWWESKAEKRS